MSKCKHTNIVVVHCVGAMSRKACEVRCRDCEEVLFYNKNLGVEKAYSFISETKSKYSSLIDLTCDNLNEVFDIPDGFK